MNTYVIIGGSAAGLSAAHTIHRLALHARIILITDQADLYNKCLLADWLSGVKKTEDVYLQHAALLSSDRVSIHLNTRVLSIHAAHKIIQTERERIFYDALLLATGSRQAPCAIAGSERAGVFPFHTWADARALDAYILHHTVRTAVVIGAGLSGLECADSLRARGIHVSVVERNPWILYGVVNEPAAQYIQERMRACEVHLYTSAFVEHITPTGVLLRDGTHLQADVVVLATGLVAATELASSLDMHNGALLVSEHLRTSDPYIYAAGDCIAMTDPLSGRVVRSRLWADASMQGIFAAHAIVGMPRSYAPVPTITSSSFFGIQFFSAGEVVHATLHETKQETVYQGLLVVDGVLRGYVLVGAAVSGHHLRRLLMTGERVTVQAM